MRLPVLLFSALFALAAAGPAATPAATGGGPAPAQGCLNQWVPSGPYRIRATKVEAVQRVTQFDDEVKTGWGVVLEWRGAGNSQSGRGTGAVSWHLIFADGTTLGLFDYDDSSELDNDPIRGELRKGDKDWTGFGPFFEQKSPAGATRKGELEFWHPRTGYPGKPIALTIEGENFVTPHFAPVRIKLNCALGSGE
jgi:hypothetical protein